MWDRIGFGRGEYIGLMASYLLLFTHFSTLLSVLLLLSLWLVTGGLTWCYLAYHTLPRDLRLLCRGLKLLLRMAYVKVHDTNIVQCFRNTVSAYPNRVMYVMLRSLRFFTRNMATFWPVFSLQNWLFFKSIFGQCNFFLKELARLFGTLVSSPF